MQEDTTNSDYPQLSNGTVEFQMMMSEMMSEMKIVIDTTSTDVKYVLEQIQSVDQEIKDLKEYVTTKDSMYPPPNAGLYPQQTISNL